MLEGASDDVAATSDRGPSSSDVQNWVMKFQTSGGSQLVA